jgi:hypothetical protein
MLPDIVRWTARLAALAVAICFTALMVGEIATPHSGPPTVWWEWSGIALVAISIWSAVLAWKWELAGALVSLAALVAFVLMSRLNRFGLIAAIATPGVLFLIDWTMRHVPLKHDLK